MAGSVSASPSKKSGTSEPLPQKALGQFPPARQLAGFPLVSSSNRFGGGFKRVKKSPFVYLWTKLFKG